MSPTFTCTACVAREMSRFEWLQHLAIVHNIRVRVSRVTALAVR